MAYYYHMKILIVIAVTAAFCVCAFWWQGVGSNPTTELQQLEVLTKISAQPKAAAARAR